MQSYFGSDAVYIIKEFPAELQTGCSTAKNPKDLRPRLVTRKMGEEATHKETG